MIFVFLVIVFYLLIRLGGEGRDVVVKEAALGIEAENQLLTILKMPIALKEGGKERIISFSEAIAIYGNGINEINEQVSESYGSYFRSAFESPCCAAVIIGQQEPIIFNNPGGVIGECSPKMANMAASKATIPSYSSPVEVEFQITKSTGIEWCRLK